MSNRLSPSPVLLQSPNHSAKDSPKPFPRSDILPNTSNSDCVCSCLVSLLVLRPLEWNPAFAFGLLCSCGITLGLPQGTPPLASSGLKQAVFSAATELCRWGPPTQHPSPGKTPTILLTSSFSQATLLVWGWVFKPPDKVVSPSYAYLFI